MSMQQGSNRSIRKWFGLRRLASVFVVAGVISAVCGIPWYRRNCEAVVADQVLRWGGTVDWSQGEEENDLPDPLGLDFLSLGNGKGITKVDLAGIQLPPDGLRQLSRLRKLSILNLSQTNADDEDIQSLESHPSLTTVLLDRTEVSYRAHAELLQSLPKLAAPVHQVLRDRFQIEGEAVGWDFPPDAETTTGFDSPIVLTTSILTQAQVQLVRLAQIPVLLEVDLNSFSAADLGIWNLLPAPCRTMFTISDRDSLSKLAELEGLAIEFGIRSRLRNLYDSDIAILSQSRNLKELDLPVAALTHFGMRKWMSDRKKDLLASTQMERLRLTSSLERCGLEEFHVAKRLEFSRESRVRSDLELLIQADAGLGHLEAMLDICGFRSNGVKGPEDDARLRWRMLLMKRFRELDTKEDYQGAQFVLDQYFRHVPETQIPIGELENKDDWPAWQTLEWKREVADHLQTLDLLWLAQLRKQEFSRSLVTRGRQLLFLRQYGPEIGQACQPFEPIQLAFLARKEPLDDEAQRAARFFFSTPDENQKVVDEARLMFSWHPQSTVYQAVLSPYGRDIVAVKASHDKTISIVLDPASTTSPIASGVHEVVIPVADRLGYFFVARSALPVTVDLD